MLLTDYFVNGQTTSYFSYYPNVLANVSSTIPCRQEIIKKDYQIFEKLVPFMLDARQIARVGVCKLFRNCLFEYENYQFLYRVIDEKLQFINNVSICLATLLSKSNHYKNSAENQLAFSSTLKDFASVSGKEMFKNEHKAEDSEFEEVDLLLDLYLILTNVDFKQLNPEYCKNGVKKVI